MFPSKKHTNLHHWPAPNGKGVLSNINSSHALTKLTLASCGRIPPSTAFGSTVHLFVCVSKSDWKAFNFVWAKIDITPFDMICQPSVWLLPWGLHPWWIHESRMAFDAFAYWAPWHKKSPPGATELLGGPRIRDDGVLLTWWIPGSNQASGGERWRFLRLPHGPWGHGPLILDEKCASMLTLSGKKKTCCSSFSSFCHASTLFQLETHPVFGIGCFAARFFPLKNFGQRKPQTFSINTPTPDEVNPGPVTGGHGWHWRTWSTGGACLWPFDTLTWKLKDLGELK